MTTSAFDAINGLEQINNSGSPEGIVEYKLKSVFKNYSLYARHWPVASPKAIAIIIHGAGEHCGRYDEMASLLNKESIYAFANDHIGHGRSDGEKLCLDKFETYTDDCHKHLLLVQERFPDLKVFCIGHSLGGLIAVDLAVKIPKAFAGVVLISPCLAIAPEAASFFTIMAMKVISFFLPKMQINRIDAKFVSRDEKEVESYNTDPLVWHGGLRAHFCKEVYDAVCKITKISKSIEWPYLVMHGDQDKLCEISGSESFHNAARSSDKTYKRYEGFYHALHKEPVDSRKIIFEDLLKWINDRMD
ncbi:uncharacterized protein TRIADDRAFT_52533 [Trichoplax adhaerens]|uniref:Serine aminopeptidase S33 domain-containing protein n=1 Tax=Trichoplax adhaerens TaxID=10228 RepID=B3RJ15_TRIAD|nr:hypothetical protein TRIADDRAFT_52533 [Trichoplax adhaerens]EDV29042.1 hypothetical protein TRIADDRAFT_52533 [Trichoplax adhaerens]|eukprot:XP_002108244.1 hypothetical protein TRIADDRAFT_52533 [Trichoplax adhaerens]